jgi:hypothetical protein
MPRPFRAELFDPKEVCIGHCIQECVGRAFRAGEAQVSGRNFEALREWIGARLESLDEIFRIDVLTYAHLCELRSNSWETLIEWY